MQAAPTLDGVTILERGWLSSNNVLLHGRDADEGAVLVDAGHVVHAAQTVELVRHALGAERLARIVNTHLHSDHCGGNAALQAAWPRLPVDVPPGSFDAVVEWDEARLSYRATGQQCARFAVHGRIEPGSVLAVGGRRWDVIAAPGHDPDSVMLFDAAQGVLISADALWRRGFGVVFPELEGERAFDDAGAVLALIERLAPALVIPGHGAPFAEVADALVQARQRLAAWQSDPRRHARHAARSLIKYHVMEVGGQEREALLDWIEVTPLHAAMWRRHGADELPAARAWGARLVDELIASGALRQDGARIVDAA
jgi:glyoxylase-like metal-dependent hydrolase (beta-lactamase superfamily II)